MTRWRSRVNRTAVHRMRAVHARRRRRRLKSARGHAWYTRTHIVHI